METDRALIPRQARTNASGNARRSGRLPIAPWPILLWLCLAASGGASVDELKALTDQAMKAESKGQYAEAVRLYEAVIEKARQELGEQDPRLKTLREMRSAAEQKTRLSQAKGPGPAKGPYDPSLGQDGLVSMVVPDAAYPGGQCTIWVPNESARQNYLNNTEFLPSALTSQTLALATPADVNPDLTRFGYKTSAKPPAYIPAIQYPDETPIYPFVGQMVPGTNVQYTDPPIDPVWLVDITPDNQVVPALTTIDYHDFRSINWPRERYLNAIQKARRGQADSTITGMQSQADRTLNGVIMVTGDYAVWEYQSLIIQPGTVVVMDANSDDSAINITTGITEGRIEFIIANHGTLNTNGTGQRPVVWTSNAQNPKGADWALLVYYPGSSQNESNIEYILSEYSCVGLLVASSNAQTEHSIVRYTEADLGLITAPSSGISVASSGMSIERCELHNNSNGVTINGDNQHIIRNLIYNNHLTTAEPNAAKGIFTDQFNTRGERTAEHNIIIKCESGLSPEGQCDENIRFYHNIVALNQVGVAMFYGAGQNSTPIVAHNNVWYNYCEWWQWPPPGRIVNYEKGSVEVGGPWIVDDQYAPLNTSQDPQFRNVRIWDLDIQANATAAGNWPSFR